MKRATQIATLTVLAAASFALLALGILLVDADFALAQLGSEVAATQQDVHLLAERTAATLDTLNRTAEQQRKYWFVLDQRTSRTLKATEAMIQHTDASLNGPRGAIPNLTAAVALNSHNMAEVTDLAGQLLVNVSKQSEPLLRESTDAVHNVEQLAGDPEIRRALKELANASENSAKATATINGILDDLRHPERPSRWVRAVSILLSILRGTSMAGQSAPVFGH